MEYIAINSLVGLKNVLDENRLSRDSSWVLATLDHNPLDLLENSTNSTCVPSSAESLVFLVNMGVNSTIRSLNLTQELVLGIYNGTISKWSSPDIVKLNPQLELPDVNIVQLYWTGASGTTNVLSAFFSSISDSWRNAFGESSFIPFQTILNQKVSIPVTSNMDMINYVSLIDYSIGYTSLSNFEIASLSSNNALVLVNLMNTRNEFIRPDEQSMKLSVSNSISATNKTIYPPYTKAKIPDPAQLNLFNVNASNAYPISFNFSVVPIPSLLYNVVIAEIDTRLMCGEESVPCKNYGQDISKNFLWYILIPLITACAIFVFLIFVAIALRIYVYILKKRPKHYRTEEDTKESELTQSLITAEHLEEFNTEIRNIINADEISLEEQVGIGSFAQVFKGNWKGAPVAIKRFSFFDIDSQKEVLDDFYKETALMSSLHHPNIVKFYGVAKKHPYLYLITEYCEKGSLYSILNNKEIRLSNRKILKMALDVVRGMEYLHGSNPPIIHRDLKTGNLLCDKGWTVKVADFGLSRVVDSNKRRMTFCGTIETCAPEILNKDRTYTEKVDVYSFGIVLWEMHTRQPIYPDLNFFELSEKIVYQDLRPDINLIPPKVHKNIPILIKKCWQREPKNRPSFTEIRLELEAIMKEEVDRKSLRTSVEITNDQMLDF